MCGDADILITRIGQGSKQKRDVSGILQKLVRHLQQTGFILERLGNDMIAKTGSETFMGICRVPGENQTARRIDLKVFPSSQFGYAVLYFTGSADLNKTMRVVALANGYSLSEASISKLPPKNGTVPTGKLTPTLAQLCARKEAEEIVSERDIFKAFQMDYI